MKGKRDDKVLGEREVGKLPLTIKEGMAHRLLDLVGKGTAQEEAEKEAGITLDILRKDPTGLQTHTRALLERAEATGLLKTPEQTARIAKARLLELSMQDGDLRVATAAAKALLGVDGIKVGVQVNVLRDEKVVASLKSLGIEDVEVVE